LKLTTDRHEASRSLSATAGLLVFVKLAIKDIITDRLIVLDV